MATLKDFVEKLLCQGGVQQATGVRVEYPGGVVVTIHSDDHPALNEAIDEDAPPTVTPVQSAQGG